MIKVKIKTLFLIMLVPLLTTSARAENSLQFELPIDCQIGENCWVMNYVDTGPIDDHAATDHQCLNRSYDGHKGTDIAIRDKVAMNKGVAVLAAADGIVKRIRDGEIDRFPTKEDLDAAKEQRKECGNAVLIDHGHGLQTLYCHMKKGSILVQPEQEIKAGDQIGEVGLSGYTQFPHIHFGIVWEGAILDPFTGLNNTENCGQFKQRLWAKDVQLSYSPLTIYDAGFFNGRPNLNAIDRGERGSEIINVDAPALTFWSTMFGIRQGDIIRLTIEDSEGAIFAHQKITQEKTRARQFYFTGRKTKNYPLKAGTYTGTITVTRPSENEEPPKSWSKTQTILIQ